MISPLLILIKLALASPANVKANARTLSTMKFAAGRCQTPSDPLQAAMNADAHSLERDAEVEQLESGEWTATKLYRNPNAVQ